MSKKKPQLNDTIALLEQLRTYYSSTLVQPDLRQLLQLILANIEVLDTEAFAAACIPFVRQALDNEAVKAQKGVSTYEPGWEQWFNDLVNGELLLHRPNTIDWWLEDSERALQEELTFAQDRRLIPNPAVLKGGTKK